MATKLKNLKVKKVDFVDEGANPDAHIELFKRKDGKPEEDPKKPKEDDEEEEKQNEGGVMKRLLSAIAKMVGINPGELNSAIEEIEKGNSRVLQRKDGATKGSRKSQMKYGTFVMHCSLPYALFYGMKTWTEQEPQQL